MEANDGHPRAKGCRTTHDFGRGEDHHELPSTSPGRYTYSNYQEKTIASTEATKTPFRIYAK